MSPYYVENHPISPTTPSSFSTLLSEVFNSNASTTPPVLQKDKKIKELSDNMNNLLKTLQELVNTNRELTRTNKELTNTNKRLSGEVNDSNKYTRALEKTWDSKQSPVLLDYGKATNRGLMERMTITRIVRPDIMSRDLMFQIIIPEDWERMFNHPEGLIHFIESRIKGLLRKG